ncbi:MAG: response regulator [Treponema sp.]|jgi:DNA-binding response OmpR family regulator|nr:response regulator [Treponema sp.]
MKRVLIIDESPLFREYLREKLTQNKIEVDVATNVLEGISRTRTMVPDLIIMDYHLACQENMQLLIKKRESPSTVGIPIIITAQRIDQRRIIELVAFNVKKVFTKPVKIDAFFASLTEMLGVKFELDDTPGIVDVHVNDNIIFIETAQGFNRDKLDLLKFKIIELVELYDIKIPKVIVMLSDMRLNYADGPNLEKLMDTALQASGAANSNVRVLTRDEFVRKVIAGQKRYAGIEAVDNLQAAMGGFTPDQEAENNGENPGIPGDMLLRSNLQTADESVHFRFSSERKPLLTMDEIKEFLGDLKIAVVDDDFVIQEMIRNTFRRINASVSTYNDGEEFLAAAEEEVFSLVFLDLMMPKLDGFAVLRTMQVNRIEQPVIVLSAISQRGAVIRAFKMGIKSYLIKPLKPDDIFRKSLEILKANF